MESKKVILMKLFPGRNRGSDIENKFIDTVVVGESGMNWESSIEMYTLAYAKWAFSKALVVRNPNTNARV